MSFGYDIEFGSLKLMNCKDQLYNSYEETYSQEEIADLYTKNYSLIKNEIKYELGK